MRWFGTFATFLTEKNSYNSMYVEGTRAKVDFFLFKHLLEQ